MPYRWAGRSGPKHAEVVPRSDLESCPPYLVAPVPVDRHKGAIVVIDAFDKPAVLIARVASADEIERAWMDHLFEVRMGSGHEALVVFDDSRKCRYVQTPRSVFVGRRKWQSLSERFECLLEHGTREA